MGVGMIADLMAIGDHLAQDERRVPSPDWFELGRRWQSALKAEGLTTTGFHMSKCEYGGDPPYTMDRDARDRLQRRFIDIIIDTPLNGFSSAIEQAYYDEIIHDIERNRKGFHKPYYLAFQATVELMSMVLENARFPRDECIAFVFDQHQEHQGKAKEIYDSMKLSRTLSFRHRLGSLTFDSNLCRPQIQAADIWAYESMRYIRDVTIKGEQPRWQFDRLTGGKAYHNIKVLDRQHIEELARLEGWI